MKILRMELLRKYRYPALILLLGLALLLIPSGGKQKQDETVSEVTESGFSLSEYTREMEELLSEVQGAGEVHLLLSLDTDGETSYLSDRTESVSGDSSQTQLETVLTHEGGDQLPVVEKKTYPKFRGAVVVCSGADEAAVTLRVKEAVSCLTGLGMDRITVLKLR